MSDARAHSVVYTYTASGHTTHSMKFVGHSIIFPQTVEQEDPAPFSPSSSPPSAQGPASSTSTQPTGQSDRVDPIAPSMFTRDLLLKRLESNLIINFVAPQGHHKELERRALHKGGDMTIRPRVIYNNMLLRHELYNDSDGGQRPPAPPTIKEVSVIAPHILPHKLIAFRNSLIENRDIDCHNLGNIVDSFSLVTLFRN